MSETQSVFIVDAQVENLKFPCSTPRSSDRIQLANSGAEALDILRQAQTPDLFLLDIMMPDMDGYALCQRLKSMPGACEAPVIFLTGKDRPEDE